MSQYSGRNYVVLGDYNVICDRCGFKYKASECKMEWDNLFVCSPCWETKQPQYFIKGVADKQTVPLARPRTVPQFINGLVNPGDL